MGKKKILIADDEEEIRMILAMALKTYNYEIDIVEDGLEAINNFYNKPYDLIITDYMMPKMDGLELIRRVRLDNPSTPILIITGNELKHDFLGQGATFCLGKPFSILKIRNIVTIMLNTR